MRYKDFEGNIEELIAQKLEEIEQKENVRIIHAVESGSRAWGFASPDSDYDVRFIYIRPAEYYLRLEDKKDFIEWELDDTLDINGWDLSKVLQHFHKSNATLFEWSNSPVVYRTTKEWENIYERAKVYFSNKQTMYHYYGTASKNYHEHLQQEQVRYKKYFYVLRPILAYKWIKEKKCPPPVLFEELKEAVLEKEMRAEIAALVEKKIRMNESEAAPGIAVINEYIRKNLEEMKTALEMMCDDRKPEWDELNKLFREAVGFVISGNN